MIVDELQIYSQTDNIFAVKYKISLIQLQDEYVVYDHLSGDTHLLDKISGELVNSLNTKAMSRTELLQKLANNFDGFFWEEINNYLDVFIDRFVALDLLISTKQRA